MTLLEFFIVNQKDILGCLIRHFQLVGISVIAGMLIAVPLGIFLTRVRRIAPLVLNFAGMIQTIPGLVMLGFALLLFGIGLLPALLVLSIYAILPILHNTYTGITEVEKSYIEAARGIGMTDSQILLKVELPLALSTIVGGIRTSTVFTVSWATLAGLIGAGGLGDLIWTGLSTYNTNFILAGAIPSAIVAVILSGLIHLIQKKLTPRGLKGVSA
ncbi:ABC transporter permease [Anoxybacterium hadale]|uniref:ABC transporter permease n=1 Tax=Anoxybacterium hadale TaxID=3408580 RepID=A0ACD1ADS9_9FIRM|nr:ABC transporter permease [Clostridiales bacterium]